VGARTAAVQSGSELEGREFLYPTKSGEMRDFQIARQKLVGIICVLLIMITHAAIRSGYVKMLLCELIQCPYTNSSDN
jgi:hypothetical protein